MCGGGMRGDFTGFGGKNGQTGYKMAFLAGAILGVHVRKKRFS